MAEILGDASVTGARLADGMEIAAAGVFVYVRLEPNGALAPASVRDNAGAILTGFRQAQRLTAADFLQRERFAGWRTELSAYFCQAT